jgi:hypothetical protein
MFGSLKRLFSGDSKPPFDEQRAKTEALAVAHEYSDELRKVLGESEIKDRAHLEGLKFKASSTYLGESRKRIQTIMGGVERLASSFENAPDLLAAYNEMGDLREQVAEVVDRLALQARARAKEREDEALLAHFKETEQKWRDIISKMDEIYLRKTHQISVLEGELNSELAPYQRVAEEACDRLASDFDEALERVTKERLGEKRERKLIDFDAKKEVELTDDLLTVPNVGENTRAIVEFELTSGKKIEVDVMDEDSLANAKHLGIDCWLSSDRSWNTLEYSRVAPRINSLTIKFRDCTPKEMEKTRTQRKRAMLVYSADKNGPLEVGDTVFFDTDGTGPKKA